MKSRQRLLCSLWNVVVIGSVFFKLLLAQELLHAQSNRPYGEALYSEEELFNKDMVARYYQINNQQWRWFARDTVSVSLRSKLLQILDRAPLLGLSKFEYHYDELVAAHAIKTTDSLTLQNADRLFTDAALTFAKDIYAGRNITRWVYADEISASCAERDTDTLVKQLGALQNDSLLENFFMRLQPSTNEYRLLKKELGIKLKEDDTSAIKTLTISLNIYRWVNHFNMQQSIVINIPSARLQYYVGDSIVLKMKVVLGKPATPTPCMATYCNQVILYPYWNVPQQIAVNELLPLFKLFPKMADALNMQVLDKKGNIVNNHKIKWTSYNKNNFPYRFRQSTGCDNSLGVIKFNLTSPYDVYLHDTNLKNSFSSEHRYYSHGCIRLEKPIELARLILNDKLDTTFLQSCLKDQKPVPVNVKVKVPVFIVYMPVEVDSNNSVVYYKDVYDFIR
jgi:murein L,D-transpeptidase YcbB/YkuD